MAVAGPAGINNSANAAIPTKSERAQKRCEFVAALDTVASALGFQFSYLAQHREAQQFLREDRERIPTAIEELLRSFSVVQTRRNVEKEVEIAGVLMKAGDLVALPRGGAVFGVDKLELVWD